MERERPMPAYTDVAWINALPGYDSSLGVSSSLDWLRKIQESGNYQWHGYGFPTPGNDLIGALDTYNGQLSINPGTYLTSISAWTSGLDTQVDDGFKFQIYDEGAKSYVFARTFAKDVIASGNENAIGGVIPFGPHFLQSPIVIVDPGRLHIEITNLRAFETRIQLLICAAVPISDMSYGQQGVTGGSM